MSRKILIDLTYLRGNLYAGTAKYAIRIVDYIVSSNRCDEFAFIVDVFTKDVIRNKYPHIDCFVIGNHFVMKLPVIRVIWLSFAFRRFVNKASFDVVFCPWANYITCLRNNKKVVSVIHDLQPLIDWKGFLRYHSQWMFDRIVNNSSLIVTISDFSKKQILSFYPNTYVENWGNSVDVKTGYETKTCIRNHPYILYVGRICKMKNVVTLVKAFARIHAEISERLVVVGHLNEYWEKEIRPIIEHYSLQDKILVLEGVSEQQLSSLYRNSSLFVFPSMREGFGFPPVEASLSGIPVLSTKEDSLEEVSLGLWYTYENPLDDEELCNKMKEILINPPSEERLRYISEEMKKHYSLDVVCKKICDNLQKL